MLQRSKGRGRPAVTTPRRTRPLDGVTPMNAPITKDQFTFSLGNLSYVDSSYDEVTAPVVKAPKRGVGYWLGRAVAALSEWRQRQVVMHEMDMMTDHELADIGLTRSDVARVFDPAFAADHARGRGHVAH